MILESDSQSEFKNALKYSKNILNDNLEEKPNQKREF